MGMNIKILPKIWIAKLNNVDSLTLFTTYNEILKYKSTTMNQVK